MLLGQCTTRTLSQRQVLTPRSWAAFAQPQHACKPATRCRHCKRSYVSVKAAAKGVQEAQLFGYDGSAVARTSLSELQLLHRRSFGHRNARTYLVMLVDPGVPACAAIEQQAERLASGTLHEPSLVVAAMDVTSAADAPAFVTRVLGVTHLPAALLYPEGAPGCLLYTDKIWTAEALLAAVNKVRSCSLPDSVPFELIEAYTPMGLLGQQLESGAVRPGTVRPADASGWHSLNGKAELQEADAPAVQSVPLRVGSGGYWTQGKVAVWAGVVFLGVAGYLWDTRLASVWDDWCLERRQAARQQGRKFTAQENVDDFVALLLQRVPSWKAAPIGTPVGTPIGAFSSHASRPSTSVGDLDSGGSEGMSDNHHAQLPLHPIAGSSASSGDVGDSRSRQGATGSAGDGA